MATNDHKLSNKQQVLLELVKAGLFGRTDITESTEKFSWASVDWGEVYGLASVQGVLGLVLAGLERIRNFDANLLETYGTSKKVRANINIPQALLLQMIGEVQMTEQRNKTMNAFIAEVVEKMRAADIYTLLVKGQGVAQCYEKPLWRPSGDVDFLLSEKNYKKAKAFLLPLSSGNKNEERYSQHLGMNIMQWYVEIHGSLRTGLAARVDRVVDKVINSVFCGGNVRSWNNGGVQVFLPAPTEDVFLVFTHFIKHFYKEGMSLRQVCDWCRLLYTYRKSLNYGLLEKWVCKAGLMEEWKAFYIIATKYLGLPDVVQGSSTSEATKSSVRLMIYDSRFDRKAERLMAFILGGYSGNKMKDTWQIAKIFPWKALRYSPSIFLNVNWLKVKERLFNSK